MICCVVRDDLLRHWVVMSVDFSCYCYLWHQQCISTEIHPSIPLPHVLFSVWPRDVWVCENPRRITSSEINSLIILCNVWLKHEHLFVFFHGTRPSLCILISSFTSTVLTLSSRLKCAQGQDHKISASVFLVVTAKNLLFSIECWSFMLLQEDASCR